MLVGQPVGQALALAPPLFGEDGVGRPLGPYHALGKSVAHEEQVHVADRSLRT